MPSVHCGKSNLRSNLPVRDHWDQDLAWPSKIVCSACCFLALACALRAFRGARDVLEPGQARSCCVTELEGTLGIGLCANGHLKLARWLNITFYCNMF